MNQRSGFNSCSPGHLEKLPQMRPRVLKILYYLLEQKQPIHASELARQNAVNPRTIRYDLEELEKWMKDEALKLVRRNGQTWLEGTEADKSLIRTKLNIEFGQYVSLQHPNRIFMLLAKVLSANEPLVVKQLTDLLQVSARTIYGDLDETSHWLESAGLSLVRKPHFGMIVQGPELSRRYACHRLITEALNISESKLERRIIKSDFLDEFSRNPVVSLLINPDDVQRLTQFLQDDGLECFNAFHVDLSFVIHLAIVLQSVRSGRSINFLRSEARRLQENSRYGTVRDLIMQVGYAFHMDLPEEEVCYVTLHVLCTQPQDEIEMAQQQEYAPAKDMVKNMLISIDNVLSVNLIREDPELLKGLIMHVKPMMYRVMYGVPIQNKWLDQIRSEHALAFHMAVVSSQVMERELGKPVNSTEVGYLALHFAATLERVHFQDSHQESSSEVINTLVICGGGIGTSRILKTRIETEFSDLKVVGCCDAKSAKDISQFDADIAITTVPLTNFQIPWMVVNPLLPQNDIVQIQNRLNALYGEKKGLAITPQVTKEIMDVLEKYFQVSEPKNLEIEVSKFLEKTRKYYGSIRLAKNSNTIHVLEKSGNGRRQSDLMLLDLITENTVLAKVEAPTPGDVIETAGNLLLNLGIVEDKYLAAMKDSLIQNGPYMVIVPGVAILHARPEDGVNEVCMSLVTLKKGVKFGHKDNDPVDIAIVMGAVDHNRHLNALSELMKLLSNVEALSEIRSASSTQQILEVIRRVSLSSDASMDGEAI